MKVLYVVFFLVLDFLALLTDVFWGSPPFADDVSWYIRLVLRFLQFCLDCLFFSCLEHFKDFIGSLANSGFLRTLIEPHRSVWTKCFYIDSLRDLLKVVWGFFSSSCRGLLWLVSIRWGSLKVHWSLRCLFFFGCGSFLNYRHSFTAVQNHFISF